MIAGQNPYQSPEAPSSDVKPTKLAAFNRNALALFCWLFMLGTFVVAIAMVYAVVQLGSRQGWGVFYEMPQDRAKWLRRAFGLILYTTSGVFFFKAGSSFTAGQARRGASWFLLALSLGYLCRLLILG